MRTDIDVLHRSRLHRCLVEGLIVRGLGGRGDGALLPPEPDRGNAGIGVNVPASWHRRTPMSSIDQLGVVLAGGVRCDAFVGTNRVWIAMRRTRGGMPGADYLVSPTALCFMSTRLLPFNYRAGGFSTVARPRLGDGARVHLRACVASDSRTASRFGVSPLWNGIHE